MVGTQYPGLGGGRCRRCASRSIAAATKSAVTPSRTNAPAISTTRSLAAEIARNRGYFRTLDSSIAPETFAYPFGYGSFARKQQLKDLFQTCRSIVPGVNTGSVDLQFLRAMPLIDRQIDRDGIERAFDEAQATNGWLIFYTATTSPTGRALMAARRRCSIMRWRRLLAGKSRL